ncbi:hypothetical protein D3C72_1290640 [compost metagenome]
MHRDFLPVGTCNGRLHGLGILCAEVENMADFDTTRRNTEFFRHRRFIFAHIDHFLGRGIERSPILEDRPEIATEISVAAGNGLIEQALVAEHGAFARIGQHDPFMAEIAANGARIGAHRNGRQPHAGIGPHIGHEHPFIGLHRVFLVEVEGISVLHQEFPGPHRAKARSDLVAELPLDVVEVQRQVLVGFHIGPEDIGDHFLVGRAIEEFALMPVLDAQHLLAVGVVAPRLAPEIGGLDGGHQKLDRAGAILLLLDDLLHLHEHLVAERQPGIEAGGLLTDHAGTQHQPMRDNFGFLGNVTQHRQEIAGKAHGNSEERMIDSRVSLMPTQIASVHSMQACKLCRICVTG